MNSIPLPTEVRYHLKCKVVVKEVSYTDVQSKGESTVTEELVYLIPQEGTQRNLFLNAWLPDVENENSEIGLLCGNPVNGFMRTCLRRRNRIIDEHHIFVMSRGAEQELKDFIKSQRSFFGLKKTVYVDIESLGEQEDYLLDTMKDFHLSNKKEFANILSVKDK